MFSPAEKAKNLYLIGDCNNLVTQAIHLVDFLREVDQNRHIYELKNIKRAVYRYEHFWLPLAAKYPDETLCAPLDIQWVWHCHMLAPRAYVEDCKAIVGTVLDHEEKNSYERHISLNKSASYWERLYGDEPFNVNYSDTFDETMLEHFKSKISYDILSSAKRQSSFYYQVSLPHYKDRTCLLQAKERYKKFLYLRKQNVGDYLVPCYDIDLIWHTHMKTPLAYKKDTEKILGYHFNHDDSTTDRSDGSKLSNGDRVTKRKWKDLYGEPYVKAGAMYRGEPSVGTLETISKKSLFEMSEKYCCISIKKVIARRTPSDNRRKSKFKIDCWSREVDGTTKDDHLFHLTSSNAIQIDDDIFEWDVSVPVIYPKNKAIPCSNLLSLVLTEKRRVALFWSSRKETGSMEHVLNVDKIYKETEGDVSRVITLYFRLGCLDVTVEAKHTDIKAKPLKLHLSPGWYTNAIIPENIRQLWGPVPFHKLPVGGDNSCIVATHRLNARLAHHFTVRVVHSVPLMTSVVQVFHEDQMLAISHLIGTEQLPLPTQINQSQSEIPALNPKIGQRAMLIKNTGGDWGIVTGEWHGFKKGKAAIRVGRRTFGGVKRNLGALLVNLYKNCPENSIEHTSSSFNYNQYANWSFKLDAVQANFNHGHVNISSTTEVPENIALTFSVALLHVFCVPRPKDWTEGQPFEPKTSYFEWKTSDIRISDALTFFRAAGILHNTPSNHYIRNKPVKRTSNRTVKIVRSRKSSSSEDDEKDDSENDNGDYENEDVGDDDYRFDDNEQENEPDMSGVDDMFIDWDDLPGDGTCGGIYGDDDGGGGYGMYDGDDFGACGGYDSIVAACGSAGGGSSCGGGGGGGGGGCGSSCGSGGDDDD